MGQIYVQPTERTVAGTQTGKKVEGEIEDQGAASDL